MSISFPRNVRTRRRLGLAGLTAAALGTVGLTILPGASPAAADTDPQPPATTPTVSADALPTVQINGIVYDEVIVGNRAYVTGEFTKARPAGSAAGTNETTRNNILAFDLTTGALVTSWAPSLNAGGRAIAASADGTRIIVAGSFTQVNGTTRNRVAELNATTGALLSPAPSFNARVSSIAVSGDTLYAGGIFTSVGGQSRTRLAAVSISTGAVLSWAPTADAEVLGIVAPAGSGKVVAGGKFTLLNGNDWYGMGALDAATGASVPWAATSTVRNAGADAAIYSLTTDGPQVYGTGYTFGAGGNFEGTFAASSADGTLAYVTGCRGDTYDAAAAAGVLYHVGHVHDCSSVGGNPQTDPWTFERAYAQTTTPDPTGAVNQGGNFGGWPAPQILHWQPNLDPGTYSGASQAAWSVTANSDYVILGGEFPRVNNKAQQGLVRFALRSIAPNKEGPQDGSALTPTLVALEPGRVRVSWKSSWDRDNALLTYEVMRGTPLANAQVIATLTKNTDWWNRPNLSFTDTTAPAGTSQTYRIRVRDPLGNVVQGNAASVTVPAGNGTTSPYRDAVRQDGAQALWPLNEPSGTTAYDYVGADDVTLGAAETRGTSGALVGDPSTATTFAGTEPVAGVDANLQPGPGTFTAEAWFRTTTTSGGKILGFGNSNTGISGNYDRHVYMRNDGRVVFGVYPGGVRTLVSPTALNDGQWHQLVGALGPDRGMELFVDGKRVGRDAGTTSAQPYSGYWRIGGDNLDGWPDQPSSRSFAGDVDEVAVYPTALPLDRVQAHYVASGRTLNIPTRPADAYGAAVWDSQPTLYWRLDDTSGPNVVDRMTNDPGATASSGVVLGEPGGPMWTGGRSARLPGGSTQTIVESSPESNPTVYSLEAWFKTTTTNGGRILGFGNSPAGQTSWNYDRHIYMLNDGRLRYGIWTGQTDVVDSPKAYNDGQWHQVVATQGPNGQQLFVDGALVGTGSAVTPQGYDGYWRVGTDNTWGGANTNDFAGSIDEVAVYPSVLPAQVVGQHWQLGASNQPPTAAFTSSCAQLACAFDGAASADADGSIASYAWQFGDGATGTGKTPSHTYAAAGSYDVVLTVTDDDGATGSVTHTVTVAPANAKPTAAFASSCTNLACAFDAAASADADGSIASYAWQFGDGATGTGKTPSHTYAAGGSYDVKLTVTDDDGATDSVTHTVTVAPANTGPTAAFTSSCPALACAFDGTGSADADGSIASYAWDFGDGATGTGATPSHTYAAGTYTVTLTVTDDDGATGSVSHAVTVAPANAAPTAAFTRDCTNLACSFDGTGSADADGSVVSYAWTFGDGQTATGATASHTYAAAGSYDVKLTVTDDDGATGSVTHTVTVSAANAHPTAAFTSSCAGLGCTFDGTGSADADGSVVSWAWQFGDGQTATGATASHTYAAAGSYDVTLTVTDDDGGTDTVTHTVTATTPPPNQPPTAAFSASCVNLACTLNGSASADADGSIASYAWAFGDGGAGTGATATHTYAAAGSYQVTLTVTDDDGATRSITQVVPVTGPLATDGFGRTVASGFGTADLGGAWTFSGAGTSASVAGGSGRVSLPAGRTATLRLGGVSNLDTDVTHLVWTEAMPTGGGVYLGTTVRGTASGDYRGRVRIQADGSMIAQLTKVAGGTETTLAAVNVTGLTYTAGMRLRIRVQAQGASPTALRLKVWQDGTTEPAAWRVTTTDATAGLQGPGSVGFDPYVSASATAAGVVRYDDLSVTRL